MAQTNLKKNSAGYGYKYTDLAEIHNYLEQNNMSYYQYIEIIDGNDYVVTVPIMDGDEKAPCRGCRVVQATLSGKSNPAQEQGSALTYARRYSLLMAFGLATTDDDAQMLTQVKSNDGSLEDARTRTKAFALINKYPKEKIDEIAKHYGVAKITDISLDDCKDFIKLEEGKKNDKK